MSKSQGRTGDVRDENQREMRQLPLPGVQSAEPTVEELMSQIGQLLTPPSWYLSLPELHLQDTLCLLATPETREHILSTFMQTVTDTLSIVAQVKTWEHSSQCSLKILIEGMDDPQGIGHVAYARLMAALEYVLLS